MLLLWSVVSHYLCLVSSRMPQLTVAGEVYALGTGLLGGHGLGPTPVLDWQPWVFPAGLQVLAEQVALGHDFGLMLADVTERVD
jgi:hypothetical protein